MTWVRPRVTIVVAWLDRFSRNFDEGVRIQAELTKQQIGIVSIREDISTADDSAAAKTFQRMILAQGTYQVESTGERIRVALTGPERREESPGGRTHTLRSRCRDVGACTWKRRRSGGQSGYWVSPRARWRGPSISMQRPLREWIRCRGWST